MSQRRWLICTLLLVSSALAQSSSPKLKMVVILTRHGVRAPIKHDGKSDFIGQGHFAQQPWPELGKGSDPSKWQVDCDGFLTPTGYTLATLMGAYYSDYYIQQRLLPSSCPSQQVYIWADNEQRTFQTAHALAQGLVQKFPGCNVPVKSLDYKPPAPPNCKVENKTDYFFHPLANPALKSRVIPKELDNIANSINASLRRLNRQYKKELTLLQNVLLCCDSSECLGSTTCTLPTLPDRAWVIDEDKALKWEKRFSTASTASEIFLLEYATGMPCDKIGWNRVIFAYDCKPASGNYFRWMQNLHTLYFDKINRARYVSMIQGSNLANQILLRLQEGVSGSPTPLVIFAGHDTNLANIAAMLGISWRLSDLPDNDTPPAGAVVFELYSTGASPESFFVKLHYVHARLTQLRKQTVLSLSNPPEWSDITLPHCPEQCPFKTFESIMNKAIDKNFTTKGPSGD